MSVKVTGFKELEVKLKKNADMNEVKRIVRKNGAELQQKAKRKAEFKGHLEYDKTVKAYVFKNPTGNLKRSIDLEITDAGKTAEVEPTADYGAYVELGTRFMSAQPFLGPAFNEQKEKFKQDMRKLTR